MNFCETSITFHPSSRHRLEAYPKQHHLVNRAQVGEASAILWACPFLSSVPFLPQIDVSESQEESGGSYEKEIALRFANSSLLHRRILPISNGRFRECAQLRHIQTILFYPLHVKCPLNCTFLCKRLHETSKGDQRERGQGICTSPSREICFLAK